MDHSFRPLAGLTLAALLGTMAHAQLFSQWDFNSGNDAASSTGTLNPSVGMGTTTLARLSHGVGRWGCG